MLEPHNVFTLRKTKTKKTCCVLCSGCFAAFFLWNSTYFFRKVQKSSYTSEPLWKWTKNKFFEERLMCRQCEPNHRKRIQFTQDVLTKLIYTTRRNRPNTFLCNRRRWKIFGSMRVDNAPSWFRNQEDFRSLLAQPICSTDHTPPNLPKLFSFCHPVIHGFGDYHHRHSCWKILRQGTLHACLSFPLGLKNACACVLRRRLCCGNVYVCGYSSCAGFLVLCLPSVKKEMLISKQTPFFPWKSCQICPHLGEPWFGWGVGPRV